MIVLQVKCPQLSKPEATAARNENSIGDRMEKKPRRLVLAPYSAIRLGIHPRQNIRVKVIIACVV